MIPRKPLTNLPTHDVINMPPHLGDQDMWRNDAALREGVMREGGGWAENKLAAFGKVMGAAELFEKADLANRYVPEMKAFDRYGRRINQVAYHPAYHELMAVAIENEVHSFPWTHPVPGAQVVYAALVYMFNQVEGGTALARIGTAIAKYWVCKRAPGHIFEALECLGGPGYIEDSMMPRLYREAPLNSIWEGSGNIMCLDVLRAMSREQAAIPALFAELDAARGANAALDALTQTLKNELADRTHLPLRARRLTEMIATALQGALLVQHAPPAVADAFCASRLGTRWTGAYGVLPAGVDFDGIIERIGPAL